MKIINHRRDIDALPAPEKSAWLTRLAATIHRANEDGSITSDTSTIERFGYALEDFPDAPVAPYVPPVAPEPVHPAIAALEDAEKNGIELPYGETTVRLLCGDKDRALFASALTLYRTHEDLLPTEEAKAAFRASQVTFADAQGVPHALTVDQARQMLVLYGATYQALWAAAAAARVG